MNNLDQYNELASVWWAKESPFASLQQLNTPRFAFFNQYHSNWENTAVLDAGCGGGFLSEELAKKGAHVWAIDTAEQLLAKAKEHAQEGGLNIRYSKASCEQIPFAKNTFDVVVCVDVLEHLANPQLALIEFMRVLKPGGTLFFDTINRTILAKWIVYFFMENISKTIPKGTHNPKMFLKPREVEIFLTHAGFTEIIFSGLSVGEFSKKSLSFKIKPGWFKELLYFGKCKKPCEKIN
jgi:2-polyprenyl-6-hydroxyphenyl methylase / 3-demethylubiquinone-9 3-methyltransferase